MCSSDLGAISHSGEGVTINNGATLQFTGDFTLAAARAVTLGTGGGVFDTNGNSDTVAGAIGGTSLTKNGAGTMTLTGANAYGGGTTVAGGTLLVANTSGSGTGTGAVLVNSGAVLGGTGMVQGNVTNNGTVEPGSGVGTLFVGGTYSQSGVGNLAIELTTGGAHDELAVTGTATLGGTLTVSLLSGFTPHEDDAFQIVSASGLGGSAFASANLPALSGDLVWDLAYGSNAVTLSVVLPGDFDHNGVVNGADYVMWRKGLGTQFQLSDYNVWRANFGKTAGSGSGLAAASVPEPAVGWMIGVATIAVALGRVLVRGRGAHLDRKSVV